MGQSSWFGDVRATSALPLIADIRWEDRQVRFVPRTNLPRSAGLEGRQGLLPMDGSRPGRRLHLGVAPKTCQMIGQLISGSHKAL